MKKMIALFSAVFLFCALTGVNAWANDPDTNVLDRHAVWTKIINDHKSKTVIPVSDQNAKASSGGQENQTKVKVKIEDLPWKRVG